MPSVRAAVSRQRTRPLSRRHARSPGVGRLRAVGPDSALVHVHGRRGAALLDRQPPGEGPVLRPHAGAQRAPARFILIALGIFLRSQSRAADLFHVRRRADADRARLRLPLPARLDARPHAARSPPRSSSSATGPLSRSIRCRRRNSIRRPSASAPTGRITSPASRRTGTRTRTSPPGPTSGSSTSSRASGRSSTTAAAI